MRSEEYSTWSVCLSAYDYSRTTGYEAFQQNRHILFLALVALKQLVSLISRRGLIIKVQTLGA